MPTELTGVPEKIRLHINGILGRTDWKLRNDTEKVDYSEKLALGRYSLTVPSEPSESGLVASFKLYPMINCCGICVSTQAMVTAAYQHKGLGTLLNQVRIDIARSLGYSLLLCTDIEKNAYQRKILARNGWRDIANFINRRTNNRVYISCINL